MKSVRAFLLIMVLVAWAPGLLLAQRRIIQTGMTATTPAAQTAPMAPAAAAPMGLPGAPAGAAPEIRDIEGVVDAFPYPPWMVALAIVAALTILGLAAWMIVRAIRNRPAPPALTPREVALRELAQLRPQVEALDPYAFSIAVSDVLRRFVGREFGFQATRQTSPEFLASLSGAAGFSGADRTLLGGFLEKCDMIKFARVDATHIESGELLGSAVAFVGGDRS